MSDDEVEYVDINSTQNEVEDLDTISQQIVIKTVRAFLSTSNTNTAITKNLLQKHVWGETSMAKVKVNKILKLADEILQDTYGYRIQLLEPKESINAKGTRIYSTQEQWTLINAVEASYNKFIEEAAWLHVSRKAFYSELSEARGDYHKNKEQFPTMKADHELVLSGLALTVLSLVVVHSNKMDEVELLNILKKDFGLDKNKQLEIVGGSPIELLKTLDKMDYVNRLIVAMDNGEPVVEYNVGRRAKAEFTRDDFVNLLRVLYDIQDDESDPDFVERMNEALEPVYGKK